MKKITVILYSIFLSFAEIKSYKSIQELGTILLPLKNSLIIFHDNFVLYEPKDLILKKEFTIERVKLIQELKNNIDNEQFLYLWSIIENTSEIELTINELPQLIQQLKHNNTVIFSSGLEMGKFGVIPQRETLRIERLLKLGLSPSKTNYKKFNLFKDPSKTAVLMNGFLFTQGCDIYNCISEFLKIKNYSYKLIILIDHRIEELKKTEEHFIKVNIPFLGILFEPPTSNLKIDYNKVNTQFKNLIDNLIWLNDN